MEDRNGGWQIAEGMPDVRELARWFRACFPGIIRRQETVRAILSHPDNRAMVCTRRSEDAGVILWNGNAVILFCVAPEHRGAGIGSRLLALLEARLWREGHSEIRFCDGFDYLTPGIPIGKDIPAYRGNRAFFEKRGYRHSWGESECVDMAMDMRELISDGSRVGDTLRGVTYRYAAFEDRSGVLACTDDGYPEFTPYYRAEALYDPENRNERVLIAEKDGLVAGTLLVSFESEQAGVGSVGCTVTRTAYRNQGIATTMVRLGTAAFRERGIPRAYLGYTYTAIVPMYARSGYKVCMRYFMGVKSLLPEEEKGSAKAV